MLKIRVAIILSCFIYSGLKAQENIELSDETKMLLFTSVEYDGNTAIDITLENWFLLKENHYEFLQVEISSEEVLYKPQMSDSISGEYELILYKILSQNSENQSRFVLRYKDMWNEVWLRVGGYVENDLHLLFNYLQGDGITKSKLKEIIRDWETLNSLYTEVDWECLFIGYKKNSTKSECFKSAYFVDVNDFCINCSPLTKDQLNSTFSRLPLYGSFNRY